MEIYVLSLSRLLKGRSIPGKILLSQRVDLPDNPNLYSPTYERSSSFSDTGTSDHTSETVEVILVFLFHNISLQDWWVELPQVRLLLFIQEEVRITSKPIGNPNENMLKISTSCVENPSEEVQKSSIGARATDSARVMKFNKVLSGTMVILGI